MLETRVGIEAFISSFDKIKGLLKHRITDFIVEELD